MKLNKLRGPALAAAAVLLLSGASSVFAGDPTPAPPAPGASASEVEPAGADTDNLQDQTTVDVAGAADSETEPAGGAAGEPAETGAEANGPGGHEDAAGEVDHQFDGEE
jgi:hypothetical protein